MFDRSRNSRLPGVIALAFLCAAVLFGALVFLQQGRQVGAQPLHPRSNLPLSPVPTAPTAIASATPTTQPTPCVMSFTDVHETDWFYPYVYYLYCHGAISGYADGTFRPGNVTTRGQVAKIIVTAKRWTINTTGGPHFSDVPVSNPFYEYIETAYNRGVITGYADGTFRWGNNITRGQLSKVVVLASGWSINTTGGPHFSDVPPSQAFYDYIETAYNKGIISGYADGTFQPGSNCTRAQLSKIIQMALVAP